MQWTENLSKLVLAVDSVTLIAGLPTNLLALYIFIHKMKHQATPLNVFLLSLTISDLIFLFFLPLRMKEAAEMKWTMSYFLCSLSVFIFYATIYNSTLLLMAISVDRYLGVAFPIKYKLKRHPRYAMIACVIFWLVSMPQCSLAIIIQYYNFNNTVPDSSQKEVCYYEFTEEQLKHVLPVRFELFVLLFCIPFIVCSFCYIRFILILSRLPNINPQKRYRAIGLALTTLLVFIICFMPYNVSHLVGFIGWYSPDWRPYALLTSTFNACLDPLIFYFSSSVLRATCEQLIRRLVNSIKPFCCWKLLNSAHTTQRSNGTSGTQ
ncbi:free fatty acid receptor 2-like [Tachysurus fulvidraco]|uniref:free fatty acid receptor 2-like n=1 Tax=Tachysurus fulvidraco TaxID=1234273 RepID=UPI001FEDB5ED|nr:free fatty acid receptor 2-like [Tachysurus fulvidraco]